MNDFAMNSQPLGNDPTISIYADYPHGADQTFEKPDSVFENFLHQWDTNGDEMIDGDEWSDIGGVTDAQNDYFIHNTAFGDGDGSNTLSEIQNMASAGLFSFKSDGTITPTPMLAALVRYDHDKNGEISEEELIASGMNPDVAAMIIDNNGGPLTLEVLQNNWRMPQPDSSFYIDNQGFIQPNPETTATLDPTEELIDWAESAETPDEFLELANDPDADESVWLAIAENDSASMQVLDLIATKSVATLSDAATTGEPLPTDQLDDLVDILTALADNPNAGTATLTELSTVLFVGQNGNAPIFENTNLSTNIEDLFTALHDALSMRE